MGINGDNTKKCSLWFNSHCLINCFIPVLVTGWRSEHFWEKQNRRKETCTTFSTPTVKLRHLSSIYVEFRGKEIIALTPICVKSGGQNTTQRHQRGFSAARCLTKLFIFMCRKLSRIKTSWNQNKNDNLPSFMHTWKGLAPTGGNTTQQCRSPSDTGSALKRASQMLSRQFHSSTALQSYISGVNSHV